MTTSQPATQALYISDTLRHGQGRGQRAGVGTGNKIVKSGIGFSEIDEALMRTLNALGGAGGAAGVKIDAMMARRSSAAT